MESLVTVRGTGLPYQKSTKGLLVEMLRQDRGVTPAYLAQKLARKAPSVRQALYRLEALQRVESPRKGVYRLTERGRGEAENLRGQVRPETGPTLVRTLPPPSPEPQDAAAEASPARDEARYWQEKYVRLAELVAGCRE